MKPENVSAPEPAPRLTPEREQEIRNIIAQAWHPDSLASLVAPSLRDLFGELQAVRAERDALQRDSEELQAIKAACTSPGCAFASISSNRSIAEAEQVSEPIAAPACEAATRNLARAEQAEARIATYERLLKRLSEWDSMDSEADGPFWRSQIAAALRGEGG
jgi:hypothetical protein